MTTALPIPDGGTISPMHVADHYWRIHLPEPWPVVESDDLTLDEVDAIEQLTGVPWAVMNPLAALKQAKAWLLVAARHAGATVDEAAAMLEQLNLRGIKSAFQLHTRDADLLVFPPADDDEVPPVPPT